MAPNKAATAPINAKTELYERRITRPKPLTKSKLTQTVLTGRITKQTTSRNALNKTPVKFKFAEQKITHETKKDSSETAIKEDEVQKEPFLDEKTADAVPENIFAGYTPREIAHAELLANHAGRKTVRSEDLSMAKLFHSMFTGPGRHV